MEAIPKKAVVAVAVALVALAVFGAYQGWRRSAVDEAQTGADGSPLPVTAAVSGARQASALVEAPPPPLSEAQIREIARQEVRASLRSGSSSEASSSSSSSPAASSPAAPSTPRPALAPPAPIPTPAPAPAPDPAPAASAPLF